MCRRAAGVFREVLSQSFAWGLEDVGGLGAAFIVRYSVHRLSCPFLLRGRVGDVFVLLLLLYMSSFAVLEHTVNMCQLLVLHYAVEYFSNGS